MSDLLHFEDYAAGQVIDLGTYAVTAAEIREFASEFDPLPFHLDEAAARASLLGGLAASGWHVCSMLMRMIADSWLNKSASMGSNGVSEVKWLKPVFAGETLSGRVTIVSKRVSSRRPEMGIFECLFELFNQEGVKKTEMTAVVFMRVKAA
ncbi:MAG TPA: MaoC family dehydratase [Aestuariivirga sp.]|nr:MaoC family dehydratase [Aestuariivirga sp.]